MDAIHQLMRNVSVAQTVECDPSNASCFDQALKCLRQAIRVPRYSFVTKHKLACADPWMLRSMLLQRLNGEGRERNRAPTALRLWRLECGLAFQPLYRLIDCEPRSFQINV